MLLTKLHKLEGNCLLRQTVISALAPEISVSCQILVLGSMPGAISQKETEYYAHPRNLFWDCVETVFQIDRNAPYQARLVALNDAYIGRGMFWHHAAARHHWMQQSAMQNAMIL